MSEISANLKKFPLISVVLSFVNLNFNHFGSESILDTLVQLVLTPKKEKYFIRMEVHQY